MRDGHKERLKRRITVINRKLSCPYLIGQSQFLLKRQKLELQQALFKILKNDCENNNIKKRGISLQA